MSCQATEANCFGTDVFSVGDGKEPVWGNPLRGPGDCAAHAELDPRRATLALVPIGVTTWDARGYAVLRLSAAIRQAAGAFVNRPLYDLYLFRLREFSPDIVSAVEGSLDADFVVQILRGLLAEEISVRDLSLVLEGAVELRSTIDVEMAKYIIFSAPTGGVFTDDLPRDVRQLVPADYVEFVRWKLKRYISHKFTRGQSTLIVYLVDPEAERRLTSTESLGVADSTAILEAVRGEVESLPPSRNNPVILTSAAVRRRLHRLLAPQFPNLGVLAYQELSPDMNIQPIARISPDF